jgi:hypothetical protein
MLIRFASAAAVASVLIALVALGLLLNTSFTVEGQIALLTVWCLLPAIWGVWAVAAPKSWFPQHLILWGAILGLLLGSVVMFVFDVPGRLGIEEMTTWWKGALLPVIVVVYAVLWKVVGDVHRRVATGGES